MKRLIFLFLLILVAYGAFDFFASKVEDPVLGLEEELRTHATNETAQVEKNLTPPKNQRTPPSKQKRANVQRKTPRPNIFKESKLPKLPGPHQAIADDKGTLYPTHFVIDDDDIIAYGDLIIGEKQYLRDYESGEKILDIKRPEPWPKGIIPYKFANITNNQKTLVESIAKDLKEKTGIELLPYQRGKHKSWVTFKEGGQNCYAQVGYDIGERFVSLNDNCDYKAIYHEIFHVLGFFHEQNRFDRDDFIQIIWENIEEKHWPQFEKFSQKSFPASLSAQSFSFETFMLYAPTSFSNSNDFSIVTLEGTRYITQEVPTFLDFQRVKIMYQDELASKADL